MSEFLYACGHDVRVLCTFSYYPAWCLREEDRGISIRNEHWKGIPLKRIAMYIPARPSGARRILSDFSFFLSILARNGFRGWKPDVVLTASPMFSQCLAQRFIYPFRRIPRMIVVQDFVVDAALELGILKLPLIGKPLRWLERWSFRSAATLSTISDAMLEKLRGIVGDERRLILIPNWIHQSVANEIARQRQFAPLRREGVLLYSGNLGVKQGLPQFLEVFQRGRDDWNLEIHGGGAELGRMREVVKDAPGVTLGEVLPEADYVTKLLTTSACLVTQMPGVGANFLPSKLLPALAAGTPVLAVCENDSPLGREVIRGQFGEVVPPGDTERLRLVLRHWRASPGILKTYSVNALAWASHYSRDHVLGQYEAELLKLVAQGSRQNS
ncbi:glycosyltransferase [Opitutaceae bacterium TAV1]|nr:glycosyltransferase [Opitutaceae bacterium TAV1]